MNYYHIVTFRNIYVFDKAIITHDSMFIQELPVHEVDNVRFLWSFHEITLEHKDFVMETLPLFKNIDANTCHFKKWFDTVNCWFGCFGTTSIITYVFL